MWEMCTFGNDGALGEKTVYFRRLWCSFGNFSVLATKWHTFADNGALVKKDGALPR